MIHRKDVNREWNAIIAAGINEFALEDLRRHAERHTLSIISRFARRAIGSIGMLSRSMVLTALDDNRLYDGERWVISKNAALSAIDELASELEGFFMADRDAIALKVSFPLGDIREYKIDAPQSIDASF